MDDSDSGGDYSNEGRNYSTPTGTPAGDIQSPGGGWMGGGGATVSDSHIVTTGEDYSLEGRATSAGLGNITAGAEVPSAPNGGGASAAVASVATWDNLKTGLRTLAALAGLPLGGLASASSLVSLGDMYRSGAYGKFGSAPPSNSVTGATGATSAFSAWNGDTPTRSSGGGGGYALGGSPVIGWQGAIVNQGPAAPASIKQSAPGDFLGFSALRPTTQPTANLAPQGAGQGAGNDTTGMVALAIGLGFLALTT